MTHIHLDKTDFFVLCNFQILLVTCEDRMAMQKEVRELIEARESGDPTYQDLSNLAAKLDMEPYDILPHYRGAIQNCQTCRSEYRKYMDQTMNLAVSYRNLMKGIKREPVRSEEELLRTRDFLGMFSVVDVHST